MPGLLATARWLDGRTSRQNPTDRDDDDGTNEGNHDAGEIDASDRIRDTKDACGEKAPDNSAENAQNDIANQAVAVVSNDIVPIFPISPTYQSSGVPPSQAG